MEEYGEESVTGVRDVFDENGVLLIKKGMIYAPEQDESHYLGTHNKNKEKGFELSTCGAKLSINPIRMLDIEYLDWLIKGFKTRNGFK